MSSPSPERESTENQGAGPQPSVSASPVAIRRKFNRASFLASSSPSTSGGESKQEADREQPSLSNSTGESSSTRIRQKRKLYPGGQQIAEPEVASCAGQTSAGKECFVEDGQGGSDVEDEAQSSGGASSQGGSQEASGQEDEGDIDDNEKELLRFLKESKEKLEKRRLEVSSEEEEESGDEEGNQETRPSETYDEGDYEDEDLNAGTQRVMRETARGDRLGRGTAPKIQPLEDVLSKIRQRTAELTQKVKATPRVVLPCAPKARHAAAVEFLAMPTEYLTVSHEQEPEAAGGEDGRGQEQGADREAAATEEPADKPRRKEESQSVPEFQETEGLWAVGFTPIVAALTAAGGEPSLLKSATELLLGEVDAFTEDLEILPDDEVGVNGTSPRDEEEEATLDPPQRRDGAAAVLQDAHPDDPQIENGASKLQGASEPSQPAEEVVEEEEPEDVSLAGTESSEDKDMEEEQLSDEEMSVRSSSSESESEEEAEEDNQRAQREAVREIMAAERAEKRRHRKQRGGYVEDEAEMSEDEGHSDDTDAEEADDEAEHEEILRDLIGHQKDRRKDEKLRAQLHAQWLADEHEMAINKLADGVRNGFRKRRGPSYLVAEDGSLEDARRRRAAAEEDKESDHQPKPESEPESDDNEWPEEIPEFNPDDISDDEAKAKLISYQESKKLAIVSESIEEEWDGKAHVNAHYQELLSSSEQRTELLKQSSAKLHASKIPAFGFIKQERVVRTAVSLLGMSSTTSKLVPQNNSKSYVFGSSESQNAPEPQLGSEALVVDARTSFAGIKRRAMGGPPLVERHNRDPSLLNVLNLGEEGPQDKLPDMARILSHFGRKRPKPALRRT